MLVHKTFNYCNKNGSKSLGNLTVEPFLLPSWDPVFRLVVVCEVFVCPIDVSGPLIRRAAALFAFVLMIITNVVDVKVCSAVLLVCAEISSKTEKEWSLDYQ